MTSRGSCGLVMSRGLAWLRLAVLLTLPALALAQPGRQVKLLGILDSLLSATTPAAAADDVTASPPRGLGILQGAMLLKDLKRHPHSETRDVNKEFAEEKRSRYLQDVMNLPDLRMIGKRIVSSIANVDESIRDVAKSEQKRSRYLHDVFRVPDLRKIGKRDSASSDSKAEDIEGISKRSRYLQDVMMLKDLRRIGKRDDLSRGDEEEHVEKRSRYLHDVMRLQDLRRIGKKNSGLADALLNFPYLNDIGKRLLDEGQGNREKDLLETALRLA